MRHFIMLTFFTVILGCSKNQYSLPDETQQFAQTVKYNNKVDLVLVVDNSSSMDTYQNKLAQQAPGMIQALNDFGMDYQILVVTSDMRPGGNGGVFVGSPQALNRSTSNLVNVLSARIRQGTGGSDLERGLESLEMALTSQKATLRSDALLAILTLSNEDDHSSNSGGYYIDFLDQFKPKFNGYTQAWVLNFIGVPNLQSSCSTALDGIYKEPGLEWIRLAEHSGGLVQPICDTTLAAAVGNIRKRIVEVLTEFSLGRAPVSGTIVVKVNGVLIPESSENGWEYLPDGHRIKLHGTAVPSSASDTISIDFTPAEAS
jgi:hypothetical protein